LEVADLEVPTREAHEGYIRRTIGPVLGEVKIRKLGADSLNALHVAGGGRVLAAPGHPVRCSDPDLWVMAGVHADGRR
jgi:hypothetical protein